MHITKHGIICLLGFWTVMASAGDMHTSPDKWKEPRLYHLPLDEEVASQITLSRCPTPPNLPERQMSANKAYWFAAIHPDHTKGGPWNTEVLVFTERDYLVKIHLRNIHYCRDIAWVNEKLLSIRVWWGRICATDLIVDVEQERFIYREMVWGGSIAFEQFQEAKKESLDGAANNSQPAALPESVPPKPVPLVPEGAAPPSFLTKEAQRGATYTIRVYVVKSGDNLVRIAKRHDVTVKDLRTLNPELTGDRITVGQQIRVYEKPGG